PVALPARGLDQHNPRCLDEQDPRVTIATLRYLTEDCASPSRDLLGDEPEPGRKGAALAERTAPANSCHDCAACDWPNPRHAHQPLAAGIPAGNRRDLARQAIDALIDAAPVVG